MLALRLTEGLIFSSYEDRFGEKVNEDLLKRAKKLSDNGLVNINSSSLSLTLKGFLVSNAVIAYLLENT